MTELHVQKKKKPVWPWIIGVILIAVVIFLLVNNGAQKETEPALAATEAPEEVTEYIRYVRNTEPSEDMTIHHEHIATGIKKLSAALDAMVNEIHGEEIQGEDVHGDVVEVNEKKEQLKQTAEYIQKEPESLAHADSLKAAFEIASEIILTIQKEHFPEESSEVENLKAAAQAVDPATPVLEQKSQIDNFFEEAAFALDGMAERMAINHVAAAKVINIKKGGKNEN